MAKEFSKEVLRLITYQQLLHLATSWKIKKPSISKDELENQIYHHQRNQIKHNNVNLHPQCDPLDEFKCSLLVCNLHPCKSGTFNAAAKRTPTNFGRTLPICWTIAGVQFLAAIDWTQPFANFHLQQPHHSFSRFLDLIVKANFKVTQQKFNAAPIARKFI